MNKAELVEALAREFNGDKEQAAKALDAVVDTITYEMAHGEGVSIKGFGVFEKVKTPVLARIPGIKADAGPLPRFRVSEKHSINSLKRRLGVSTEVAAVQSVLNAVPESARKSFMQTVDAGPAEDLDESLWGRQPSSTTIRTAALANLQRQFEARQQIIENSVTRAEAAALLSVSNQAISALVRSGNLVALKVQRELRLPVWQFSADCDRGFVPGIAQLTAVFPGSVVSMSEWATRPNVDLDGATPAQELAAGRVDTVIELAKAGTAAAW